MGSKTNQQIYIYYELVDKYELLTIERKQLFKYQPLLNNTPIQKTFNSEVNKKPKYSIQRDCTNYMDTISTILSDFKKLSDQNKPQKELQPDLGSAKNMNNNPIKETKPVTNIETDKHHLKRFIRKFVPLKNNKIDLFLELEICIDSQEQLFVRYHTLFYILYNKILSIDSTEQLEEKSQQYISSIEYQLINLRNPIRWLGYKLNCEQILLVDEEYDLEIETIAIMLPFRMFVNLLEGDWLQELKLPELLEKEENQYWKNHDSLSLKIAKYLYDEKTTLVDSIASLNETV